MVSRYKKYTNNKLLQNSTENFLGHTRKKSNYNKMKQKINQSIMNNNNNINNYAIQYAIIGNSNKLTEDKYWVWISLLSGFEKKLTEPQTK